MFSEIDYDKIKKFREFKKLSMDKKKRIMIKRKNMKFHTQYCNELYELISIFDRIKDSEGISPVPDEMFTLYNQMC